MKKFLAAAVFAGAAMLTTVAADAQGYGRDRGRDHDRSEYRDRDRYRDHRRSDYRGGGGIRIAPGLIIGRFYNGRGYWDGRRYYQNRYRHHGGWRYR